MFSKILRQLSFLTLGSLAGYLLGEKISFAEIKDVLGSLQNMSAAVFALAGLWIAYIYPKAIISYTSPEDNEWSYGEDSTKRIEKLILTIFTSAFILVAILLFNYLHAIFNNLDLVKNNMENYNRLLLGLVTYISLLQIYSISSIMLANIEFVNRLYKLKTIKEGKDDLNT